MATEPNDVGNNDNYVKLSLPTEEQIQKDKEVMDKRGRKMEYYRKIEPLNKYIFSVQALLEIPVVPYTDIQYTKYEDKKKDLNDTIHRLSTEFNIQDLEDAQKKVSVLNKEYENVAGIKLGGSKSRRRHRRKPARKTRRGRKSKAKPKTHRRRHAHHSRIRKHKKYTRKH